MQYTVRQSVKVITVMTSAVIGASFSMDPICSCDPSLGEEIKSLHYMPPYLPLQPTLREGNLKFPYVPPYLPLRPSFREGK